MYVVGIRPTKELCQRKWWRSVLQVQSLMKAEKCRKKMAIAVAIDGYRYYELLDDLPGPRLGFFFDGSAEGVERIGRGPSTCWKVLIFAAINAVLTTIR